MEPVLYTLFGAVLGLSLLAVAARFVGFRAQRPSDYAAQTPKFDVREHLSGPILCEGVIYGPTGRVSSRFVADMDAKWEGNKGTMSEVFHYDSGVVQHREWRLTVGNDGRIKAEADDLVGAGDGRQEGGAVVLNYRIRLPDSAGGHVLDTTDWMYIVENGVIMNRSQFRKYGIKVAELVATMRKKEQ
jgi:hypothetical protein